MVLVTKMLSPETIKEIFDFNRDCLELKLIDGEERWVWKYYDATTPTPPLFNKLNDINKKRISFYAPLVMKMTFYDLKINEILDILDLHNNYDYTIQNIDIILLKLYKTGHSSFLKIRDMIYKFEISEAFTREIKSFEYGSSFFSMIALMTIYTELERIPSRYIPVGGIVLNLDSFKDDDQDINEIINEIFIKSELPEVK